MRHRRAPFFSCHPMRIGKSLWSYMMTLFLLKKSVIGGADGSEANQGVMEGENDLAGSVEVIG